MKKSLYAAAICSALVLTFGLATAGAQESVSVSEAESGSLWFIELFGRPTVDGNSLANVRAEKARFLAAADAEGIIFTARRSYDTLFNGFSVKAGSSQRARLAALPGVKAVWPVELIDAPEFNPVAGAAPDLANAIAMTGADIVQNSLGYTGAGIKVAVMDTGIDYDHADLGGDGVQRSNSAVFPTARVVAGWDFVGDAFTGAETPVPDAYPDDCGGHGSHVSGIVGANGTVKGVAPGVMFGAYRVFGCAGSTTSDIMLAAMERALADGMQVLNMSIGARAQHPGYPTAAAATRLLRGGMVVVASIGNNGPGGGAPDGVYAAGAPGVGADVIGVASYDNTRVTQPAFTVSPDNAAIGYTAASGAPTPPTSSSLPMARTGTTTTANDGCAALAAGSLAGQAVLIRRGTCGFFVKATNARNAGAAAVVLYNNAAGFVSPTVAGTPAITIPVVMVTAADGALIDGRIAGGATTMTWTSMLTSTPNPTGGLISGFSSFGLAADLTIKPDLGAPGGSIFSTVPLEQGGYGNNSGTSMSSPHVAGAVALLLQAKPGIPERRKHKQSFEPKEVLARLQNSANPTLWNLSPGSGLLDNVHRQGAGMLDIDDAILAPVDIAPGELSLGESQAGPQTRTLTIRNRGASSVTLNLSHRTAISTGPKSLTNYQAVTYFGSDATAAFSAGSVTVPAGGSAAVDVTITAATAPNQGQYGGYIDLTPEGGGQAYSVPYAGFIGDYQSLVVLTPTANGFPWLAQIVGPSFVNRNATGATYTMVGDDIPIFLAHLDHQSERVQLSVTAIDGTRYFEFADEQYVGRNTSAGGFFAFEFDGNTFRLGGPLDGPPKLFTVPDGDYVVTLSVLKALGDRTNPADFEIWTSPVFKIDRP